MADCRSPRLRPGPVVPLEAAGGHLVDPREGARGPLEEARPHPVPHPFILDGGRLVVDKEYQHLKDSTRRLRLSFEDAPPEKIALDGVLMEKRDGRRVELVVYPWSAEKMADLERLAPTHLDVQPLSLEDIFRSFVAG